MATEPHRRNRSWSRDELILALKVYVDLKPKVPSGKLSEIQELSALLRSMEEKKNGNVADDFRSPASVVMKLMNFRSLDDDYPGKGLISAGEEDRLVWAEVSGQKPVLAALAKAIGVAHASEESWRSSGGEEIGDAFEGEILTRVHRVRERNPRLVRAKKEKALGETGKLDCEACGFNFLAVYGARGDGFIECHHTVPLHELDMRARTRLEDLVLVCANCHRMLHASRPVATIAELRTELARGRSARNLA